jgi:hypothetical protein
MDDVFADAMHQIHREAPPELVKGFKEQMRFISTRFRHTSKTVASCLAGLSEAPTLLELLTAAFVVNGGVLFKYDLDAGDEPEPLEDLELDFMKAIEDLSPVGPARPSAGPATPGSPETRPPWED